MKIKSEADKIINKISDGIDEASGIVEGVMETIIN